MARVTEGLADSTRYHYGTTLRQFLQFVNCKEDSRKTIFIHDLVEEARRVLKKTQEKIDPSKIAMSRLTTSRLADYLREHKENGGNERFYHYCVCWDENDSK